MNKTDCTMWKGVKTVPENGVSSCGHYCLKSLLPSDRCDFTKKLTPGVVFTRPGVGDAESTPKKETTMPGSGDEEPSTPKNETTIPEAPKILNSFVDLKL